MNRTKKHLVYGDALGSYVFLTRQRAEDLVKVRKLADTAHGWRTIRKSLPRRMLREIRRSSGKISDLRTIMNDDGDWPFPHQEQIELLPRDVVELGIIGPTVFNGDRLDFPYEAIDEILRRLRAYGYKVVRDDGLVQAACGQGGDTEAPESESRPRDHAQ